MQNLIREAEAVYHRKLAQAEEEHAYQMLAVFMAALSRHNTRRHVITLCAGMGTAGILIDGEWFAHRYRKNHPIVRTLREIEDHLDHEWDHHLHGKRLN